MVIAESISPAVDLAAAAASLASASAALMPEPPRFSGFKRDRGHQDASDGTGI
jgi:hypothetical protein